MASQRTVYDWKVWLLICSLGALATVAIVPYIVDLLGKSLHETADKAGISFTTLVAAQIAQGIVVIAICSRIGLWAARRVGFALPIFDAIASRAPIPWAGRAALVAIGAGFAGGALDVLLDAFVFVPSKVLALDAGQPAAWEGFLASFYGGISEEVIFRLFLLSLVALGLHRLLLGSGGRDRPLPSAIFWTANVIAALTFSLGHLPATAALAPLTTSLVVRAIALNGILALLFGSLYRRYGFEMAILAHFSADIALHVVPPLVA
ncbi:MAG: CPBP family glutamic-type intramembrane protease [Croceibacterium sp.]